MIETKKVIKEVDTDFFVCLDGAYYELPMERADFFCSIAEREIKTLRTIITNDMIHDIFKKVLGDMIYSHYYTDIERSISDALTCSFQIEEVIYNNLGTGDFPYFEIILNIFSMFCEHEEFNYSVYEMMKREMKRVYPYEFYDFK